MLTWCEGVRMVEQADDDGNKSKCLITNLSFLPFSCFQDAFIFDSRQEVQTTDKR